MVYWKAQDASNVTDRVRFPAGVPKMLQEKDLEKYSIEDIELLLIMERGFLNGKRHYRCRACNSETRICFSPYGETRKKVRCYGCGKTTRVKDLIPRSIKSRMEYAKEIGTILNYLHKNDKE